MSTCPHCYVMMGDVLAKRGDWLVCHTCRGWAVIEDMGLRKATLEERRRVVADERCFQIMHEAMNRVPD